METNAPYDGPPAHLMKKAGLTMGEMLTAADKRQAKLPIQICAAGGELFALMGDGKIRVKSPTSPWIDIAEQPGDTVV